MVKIVYGHPADNFNELKVAGDFSQWEIRPMIRNSGFWEYTFKKGSLPPDSKVLHFKFIDDNGHWFADDDYAKETDSNNNENNVRLLTSEEIEELGGCSGGIEDIKEADELSYGTHDEGPVRPVPSPSVSNLRESSEEELNLAKPTVIVDRADARENTNISGNERPGSSGTVYSQKSEVTKQYKTILARIIAFFTNLFRSWFSH